MQAWESNKEENDNRRKAWIITTVINVLIFVAIYFLVVWKQPIPPLPQFGLELNLGFSDLGSGSTPTTAPPSAVQSTNTQAPAPGDPAPTPVETAVPVAQPKTEAAKPKSTPAKTTYEAKSKTASPIKGAEKANTATKEPSPVKKETTTPVTTPATSEAANTATKAEEKPKVDQRAIFGGGGTSGKSTQPAAGSAQGSSTQKGDEGKPQGTIDGRGLMGPGGTGEGKPGPGAGYNLDLAGWDFASRPSINDNVSTRTGRIVFKITVDDNGKIVQAIPLEYNVSNEVLAYYRTVVNRVTFKRQGSNPTAEYSSGKITFVIKVD